MSDSGGQPIDRVLRELQERAKELACLYRVTGILSRGTPTVEDAVRAVLSVLPQGWQFPGICVARAELGRHVFEPKVFEPTPWVQSAPITARGQPVGKIEVFYTEPRPAADEGPFLVEERRLLETVAERLGQYVAEREASLAERPQRGPDAERSAGWWIVLEFLRQTDRVLLGRVGRRMIVHLCWNGVAQAEELLRRIAPGPPDPAALDDNQPLPRAHPIADAETTEAAFRLAPGFLSDEEILVLIQGWIREEKIAHLKRAVERADTPLPDLVDALQRFRQGGIEENDLSVATQLGLRASLARRFLTDQLEVINIAKQVLTVSDFYDLSQRLVAPARSHGRIGGKSAGLFVAAKIVERAREYSELLGEIRVPRSWYVPADGILDFITHNDLSEVHSRKYLEPERIRLEYPHLVQLFKSSYFSPEILRGLGVVLDDLEGRPIIVRSSSLLEDRLGSAFSGKYKSLFLANTGRKRERLTALTDAIAEVYASVFAPDPLEYRARRGFLDLHEEMGILIQEVVGTRLGRWFLPVFSGVAFSNNEFRWSSRIRREDGLLRLVPGLGTRAVDRLADDYPVLVAPGQPGLRVNQTVDEAERYSPKKADVVDLETGSFESIEIRDLLAAHGPELPLSRQLLSVVDGDRLRRPDGLVDFARDRLVVSFDGLTRETSFVPRMRALLDLLRERLGTPVDVEFACDGQDLYLLQCRPQGSTLGDLPAPIPTDLPPERVLFTADRYVSNGNLPDLTHVVYVDPDAYAVLELHRLREVAAAVGRLNRLLPKRGFALMGPGRWGSRGDIRLGVPVTYADISNAAVLIEIARQRGGYVPDLSFGTHFFQDLVESSIRYLPLYPDDPEVVFADEFFSGGPNLLERLAPDLAALRDVVRVIDVRERTAGLVLQIRMNGELDRAVGFLARAAAGSATGKSTTGAARETAAAPENGTIVEPWRDEDHWRWRQCMAERFAADLDPQRFGVVAVYLFGSSRTADAGPASDIDLLVEVVDGLEPARRRELEAWIEGWSRALAEVNRLRTGIERDGLLDVHLVSETEVRARSGVAARIDALGETARLLPLAGGPPPA
ncbi:MAG TPA: PEP/pyruvate-binding domain-containing protein [Thermoanaerobaculia bacterium]|nr:PEP/pyruvate-binding domain-containing protein [Thermoanaerobaculia bacterium]